MNKFPSVEKFDSFITIGFSIDEASIQCLRHASDRVCFDYLNAIEFRENVEGIRNLVCVVESYYRSSCP